MLESNRLPAGEFKIVFGVGNAVGCFGASDILIGFLYRKFSKVVFVFFFLAIPVVVLFVCFLRFGAVVCGDGVCIMSCSCASELWLVVGVLVLCLGFSSGIVGCVVDGCCAGPGGGSSALIKVVRSVRLFDIFQYNFQL